MSMPNTTPRSVRNETVTLDAIGVDISSPPGSPDDIEARFRVPKKWLAAPKKWIATVGAGIVALTGTTIGAMKLLPQQQQQQQQEASAPQAVLEVKVDRVEKQGDETIKRVGALEISDGKKDEAIKHLSSSINDLNTTMRDLNKTLRRRR